MPGRNNLFKRGRESFQFVSFRTETLVFLFLLIMLGLLLRALPQVGSPNVWFNQTHVWLKTKKRNKPQILAWNQEEAPLSLKLHSSFCPKLWLLIQMWAGTTVSKARSSKLAAGWCCGCLGGTPQAGRQPAVQPSHRLRGSLVGLGGSVAGAFPHPSCFLLATVPVETVSASAKLGQCSGVRPQGGF